MQITAIDIQAAEELAHDMRVLKGPVRLTIISYLNANGPTSSPDLYRAIKAHQKTVFDELRGLVASGFVLVSSARVYSLNEDRLLEYVSRLKAAYHLV